MAAQESVGNSMSRKGTNQFMRQGHTAGPFAQDPNVDPKGVVGSPPRELKA